MSDNVVSTWRHRDTPCPYPNGDTHGDMETRRHSMSISTWRHGDTPCPYPHGDMETLHVHIVRIS